MYLDENTLSYALSRHNEFRLEAERQRVLSGWSNSKTTKCTAPGLSVQRSASPWTDLEIRISSRRKMVRIQFRIDEYQSHGY